MPGSLDNLPMSGREKKKWSGWRCYYADVVRLADGTFSVNYENMFGKVYDNDVFPDVHHLEQKLQYLSNTEPRFKTNHIW